MKFVNSVDDLYGIAFNCPYFERKDNCPFRDVEHFSFEEKVNWIYVLSS
jgi:hypothetical protein